MKMRLKKNSWRFAVGVAFAVMLASGCNNEAQTNVRQPAASTEESTAVVKELINSEDLILDLAPKLAVLARSLKQNNSFQLTAIDSDSKYIILKQIPDLQSCLEPIASHDKIFVGHVDTQDDSSRQVDPWWSFSQLIDRWDFAKFGIKFGQFFGGSKDEFKLKTVFYGKCRSDQFVIGVNASQTISFRKVDGDWQPVSWLQEKFELTAARQLLFENVTDTVIPQAQMRQAVTRSVHEEYIVNVINTGITPVYDQKYLPFADVEMNHATPSVSVIDLDRDGWDDLFITARWSRPVYLHNRG